MEQEDKPTTGYVHVCQPCDKCKGCKYECEHKVKSTLTFTDSKPEKPQFFMCEQYPVCDLTATGCELLADIVYEEEPAKRRAMSIKLRKLEGKKATQALSSATSPGSTTEPKPSGVMDEQQVRIKHLAGLIEKHIPDSLAVIEFKALLATEYDRGVKDAAQPNEWRALQDAYDRGKVDGAVEELGRKVTVHIDALTPADYKNGFQDALDQIDADNDRRIKELKSKGDKP